MQRYTTCGTLSGVVIALCAQMAVAQAGPRDVGIGIGLGIGLGIINQLEQSNRPPRNARPVGRVRERSNRRSAPRKPAVRQPSAAELAARREREQRQAEERRQRAIEVAAEEARIRDAQDRLNRLQFDAGTVDGKAGPQTRRAISDFQKSIGAAVTGVLTEDQSRQLVALTETRPIDPDPMQSLEATAPYVDDLPELEEAPPSLAGMNNDVPSLLPETTLPGAPLEALDAPSGTSAIALQAASTSIDQSPFQSSIFGIRPRDTIDSAEEILLEAGFSNCERAESGMRCKSEDNGMTDVVSLGSVAGGGSGEMYMVAREVTFAAPRRRSEVVDQLRQAYPGLLARPGYVEATGSNCDPTTPVTSSSEHEAILREVAATGLAESTVSKLLAACDRHHSIALPDGEMIDKMSIVLLDSTPFRNASAPVETMPSAPNSERPKIRF